MNWPQTEEMRMSDTAAVKDVRSIYCKNYPLQATSDQRSTKRGTGNFRPWTLG